MGQLTVRRKEGATMPASAVHDHDFGTRKDRRQIELPLGGRALRPEGNPSSAR